MWRHMRRAACGAMIAESLELGEPERWRNGDVFSWDNDTCGIDWPMEICDFQQLCESTRKYVAKLRNTFVLVVFFKQ